MKKTMLIFLCLGLLATALGTHRIPYPVDSKEYDEYKKSLITQTPDYANRAVKAGIMQSVSFEKQERDGLLIQRDSTFTLALSGNDDSSTDAIALPFIFDFYGSPQTEFYINNNGNISFGDTYSTYTPTGFPVEAFPMFAAFWADVDTRPADSGKVYYKVEQSRVTVTWENVGYYSNHTDMLNTFQIIFSNGTDPLIGIGNNIAFSYADMQWTTGDASGGTNGFGGIPATVGLNRGDGIAYALIGSFDHAGSDYMGPAGNSGIDYLDNQLFIFSAQSMAIPPFFTHVPVDPINLEVGDNTTIDIDVHSSTPDAVINCVVEHDFASGFTYVSNPGNPGHIHFEIEGRLDNTGVHTITLSATDDNDPPLSSVASFTVNITGVLDDFLISANYETGSINLLDVNTNQLYGPFLESQLGGAELLDVVVAADGSFALLSNFNTQRVYQVDLSTPMAPFVNGIYYLGFNAEDISLCRGDRFALVADGGTATNIAVLDLLSRTTVQTLDISPHYAQGVELGPDGKVLINDVTNAMIHQYLLHPITGLLSYSGISIPANNCLNVSIHPNGKSAIASLISGRIEVLELHSDNTITNLQSIHLTGAQAAIYSRDGSKAIIAEYGQEDDVLSVYLVNSDGSLSWSNGYYLPGNSGTGFFGVDTIALSTYNSKVYVGSYNGDDLRPLCVVDLQTNSVQALETPSVAGISIGKKGPYAYFDYTSTQFMDHTLVQFRNLAHGNPESWVWNFGDGQSSTELDPQHIYDEPGYYSVTLTVVKAGIEHSYSVLIEALFETNIHLYLAGSPYYFHNDIVIMEDSSLIIDQGVELIFAPGAGLTVYGSLEANGVSFTSDTLFSFSGITIDSRSQTLVLDNCEIINAVLGLKIVNSSFTINHLDILCNVPIAPQAGMMIQGACNMILNDIDIDGYFPGMIFQNEQRVASNPLLSNIRIRNSSSTSREIGTALEVHGAIALQMNEVDIEDYSNGIYFDAMAHEFSRATPLLTNIRIRNSSSTSRTESKGIYLKNITNVHAAQDSIIGFDIGMEIDNSELAGSANPLLSNIRIRNSSSTSRTDNCGLKLLGAVNATIDSLVLEDCTTGIEIINSDSTRAVSNPLLSNIRIRNSSSTSRTLARGLSINGSVSAMMDSVIIEDYPEGILYAVTNPSAMANHNPVLTNIRIRNSSSTSRDVYRGITLRNLPAVECSLLVIYPQLTRNTRENVQGSGIWLDGSTANIAKATIWGLQHGVQLSNAANTSLQKSIIWSAEGNAPLSDPILNEGGVVSVQQSNISYAGGTYAGEGNTAVDPRFVDPQSGNFYLEVRSPLRNTDVGALPFDFDELAEQFEHSFEPGWNLCGVPILADSGQDTPAAIFGEALAPFYVSLYYTSILQLNQYTMPDTLGHLSFLNTQSYQVPQIVQPGVGYWVRNPNPEAITLQAYGILDQEPYRMDLQGMPSPFDGFFMLANPYDVPLSIHNGSMALYGTFEQMPIRWVRMYNPENHNMDLINLDDPASEIPAWTAFIIKANAPGDSIIFSYPNVQARDNELQIASAPHHQTHKPQSAIWELPIMASADGYDAMVHVGIAQNADNAYDAQDVPQLPFNPYPEALSLKIKNPTWENFAGYFIRDIKSHNSDSWQWTIDLDLSGMLLDGRYRGMVDLSVADLGKIPAGLSVNIIDQQSGETYDLSSGCASILVEIDVNEANENDSPSVLSFILEACQPAMGANASQGFALNNYPNPFNPSTTFSYFLPKSAEVNITLYNIKGQKVRKLLAANQSMGKHTVIWDGRDHNGKACASGFYFCRIQTPFGSASKKILMLK